MRSYLLLLLFIIAGLTSCKKQNDEDLLKKVVLEGYLFANETVDDIRLTHLLPFGGEDTVAKPINDADVSIEWKGKKYQLVPSAGDSGYYHYPETDLQIFEGESYRIEIDYFGKIATGSTVVPPPPVAMKLSDDTMKLSIFSYLDSLLNGGEIPVQETQSITASWDNDNMEYYYVVVKNIESNPQPIYEGFEYLLTIKNLFIFTRPTQEDNYVIWDYEFTHWGNHEAIVYKINKEYVDLFNSLDQDSRTLNEPITNMTDGLGVFSAFNSAAVTFFVTEE